MIERHQIGIRIEFLVIIIIHNAKSECVKKFSANIDENEFLE